MIQAETGEQRQQRETDRDKGNRERERKYRIDERINVTTTKNNQQQQREKSSSNQELDPKVLLRIADEMLHPIVETHPWLFWRQRARAEPNSEIQRPRVENVYLCRSLVILSSGNGDTSQNRKRFCIQTHNAALQSSGLLFLSLSLSLSFSDSLTLPVSLSLSRSLSFIKTLHCWSLCGGRSNPCPSHLHTHVLPVTVPCPLWFPPR